LSDSLPDRLIEVSFLPLPVIFTDCTHPKETPHTSSSSYKVLVNGIEWVILALEILSSFEN
jgi:hypothetical protein